MGRWLRRVATVIIVLSALYAIVHFWIGSVAESRLNAQLVAIHMRGEPTSLEAMAPPPVPEEENGAALFWKAADALAVENQAESHAVDRFVDGGGEADGAAIAVVRAFVEKNTEALDRLEEALRRPTCRFDLDYTQGFGMEAPHTLKAIVFIRLLSARAWLRAADGEFEAAYEDGLRLFRLGAVVGEDPVLICFLVQITDELSALRTLSMLVGECSPAPDTRRRLLAAIKGIDPRKGLRLALLAERCEMMSTFEDVLGIRPDPGWRENFDEVYTNLSSLSWKAPGWVFRLDEAWYLEMTARAIALAGRPLHETSDEWEALDREIEDRPWYALLSESTLGVVSKFADEARSLRARLDMARIALAHEAGTAPPRLIDPFTGKPYEVEKSDDGGIEIRSPGPSGEEEIVWPVR